jgi:hypothetical protein
MKLVLRRAETPTGFTIGRLTINGAFECWTLEDEVREREGEPVEAWKVPHETAIPRGEYLVIIDYSNRFKKDLPHVLNVPGFEGVRIHSGNTSADTEGCILVGQYVPTKPNWLANSRTTMAKVMQKLEEAYDRNEEISLEVV